VEISGAPRRRLVVGHHALQSWMFDVECSTFAWINRTNVQRPTLNAEPRSEEADSVFGIGSRGEPRTSNAEVNEVQCRTRGDSEKPR
jgi:hypothetical protein